jgi:hypothetical protein
MARFFLLAATLSRYLVASKPIEVYNLIRFAVAEVQIEHPAFRANRFQTRGLALGASSRRMEL